MKSGAIAHGTVDADLAAMQLDPAEDFHRSQGTPYLDSVAR